MKAGSRNRAGVPCIRHYTSCSPLAPLFLPPRLPGQNLAAALPAEFDLLLRACPLQLPTCKTKRAAEFLCICSVVRITRMNQIQCRLIETGLCDAIGRSVQAALLLGCGVQVVRAN